MGFLLSGWMKVSLRIATEGSLQNSPWKKNIYKIKFVIA